MRIVFQVSFKTGDQTYEFYKTVRRPVAPPHGLGIKHVFRVKDVGNGPFAVFVVKDVEWREWDDTLVLTLEPHRDDDLPHESQFEPLWKPGCFEW